MWAKPAISALRSQSNEADFFILGVFVSFAGASLDNTYWQLAWSSDSLGLPCTEWFMEWGPTFNIFFRQAPGIIAAACHVKAAMSVASDRHLKFAFLISSAVGVFWAAMLWYLF